MHLNEEFTLTIRTILARLELLAAETTPPIGGSVVHYHLAPEGCYAVILDKEQGSELVLTN